MGRFENELRKNGSSLEQFAKHIADTHSTLWSKQFRSLAARFRKLDAGDTSFLSKEPELSEAIAKELGVSLKTLETWIRGSPKRFSTTAIKIPSFEHSINLHTDDIWPGYPKRLKDPKFWEKDLWVYPPGWDPMVIAAWLEHKRLATIIEGDDWLEIKKQLPNEGAVFIIYMGESFPHIVFPTATRICIACHRKLKPPEKRDWLKGTPSTSYGYTLNHKLNVQNEVVYSINDPERILEDLNISSEYSWNEIETDWNNSILEELIIWLRSKNYDEPFFNAPITSLLKCKNYHLHSPKSFFSWAGVYNILGDIFDDLSSEENRILLYEAILNNSKLYQQWKNEIDGYEAEMFLNELFSLKISPPEIDAPKDTLRWHAIGLLSELPNFEDLSSIAQKSIIKLTEELLFDTGLLRRNNQAHPQFGQYSLGPDWLLILCLTPILRSHLQDKKGTFLTKAIVLLLQSEFRLPTLNQLNQGLNRGDASFILALAKSLDKPTITNTPMFAHQLQAFEFCFLLLGIPLTQGKVSLSKDELQLIWKVQCKYMTTQYGRYPYPCTYQVGVFSTLPRFTSVEIWMLSCLLIIDSEIENGNFRNEAHSIAIKLNSPAQKLTVLLQQNKPPEDEERLNNICNSLLDLLGYCEQSEIAIILSICNKMLASMSQEYIDAIDSKSPIFFQILLALYITWTDITAPNLSLNFIMRDPDKYLNALDICAVIFNPKPEDASSDEVLKKLWSQSLKEKISLWSPRNYSAQSLKRIIKMAPPEAFSHSLYKWISSLFQLQPEHLMTKEGRREAREIFSVVTKEQWSIWLDTWKEKDFEELDKHQEWFWMLVPNEILLSTLSRLNANNFNKKMKAPFKNALFQNYPNEFVDWFITQSKNEEVCWLAPSFMPPLVGKLILEKVQKQNEVLKFLLSKREFTDWLHVCIQDRRVNWWMAVNILSYQSSETIE